MHINKLTIIWKYLTGGREAVLDYALGVANNLAENLDAHKKENVSSYLGLATKILSAMEKLAWLVPEKWNVAYGKTLFAFTDLVVALEDFKVTTEEVERVTTEFKEAYAYWMSPDETETKSTDGVGDKAEEK